MIAKERVDVIQYVNDPISMSKCGKYVMLNIN